MSDVEWDEEGEGDDEDFEFVVGTCACGSEWFVFVTASGSEPRFRIFPDGDTIETTGHPICARCGLDYPIVMYDDEGEETLFFSSDLTLEMETALLDGET